MPCEFCATLKETETWNNSWSEKSIAGPVAFRKLVYIGFKTDSHIYCCPSCGQAYQWVSWNELFPDGWTEFCRLRKLTAAELNSNLPLNKPSL